jgi:hypothetical protein
LLEIVQAAHAQMPLKIGSVTNYATSCCIINAAGRCTIAESNSANPRLFGYVFSRRNYSYIGGMKAANDWELTEQIFRTVTVMKQNKVKNRQLMRIRQGPTPRFIYFECRVSF